MKKKIAFAMLAALAVSACGGGSDTPTTAPQTHAPPPGPAPAPAPAPAPGPAPAPQAPGDHSVASVELGQALLFPSQDSGLVLVANRAVLAKFNVVSSADPTVKPSGIVRVENAAGQLLQELPLDVPSGALPARAPLRPSFADSYSVTIPAGSSAVTAPAVMQIKKRDADQLRMDERLAMPKKAAPSNAGQRQGRADEGAATRQNIASIAVGNPATTGSRQRTVESVINWLRTEKRRTVNELGDEVCLTSLGMDSLGAITLSLELERRTGVDVTPDIIFECQTIGRLAAYIAENSPVDAKPRDTAKKRALVS